MYFTYCKTCIAVALVSGVFIFSGWNWKLKKETRSEIKVPTISALDEARMAYESGEYYKARLQVQKILAKDPANTAAQQLMGDVLDKEIARQKEAVVMSSPNGTHDDNDEKSNDGNKSEVKNWIERSKTLLHQNQYDLALFAAEKVFVYDPDNHEASLLIDDIKEEAIKNGKADTLFLSKMYKEEIAERVTKYRGEAQDLIQDDKSEQAKFTLQKILMLEPEDPEALRLFKNLQKKEVHA